MALWIHVAKFDLTELISWLFLTADALIPLYSQCLKLKYIESTLLWLTVLIPKYFDVSLIISKPKQTVVNEVDHDRRFYIIWLIRSASFLQFACIIIFLHI